MDPIITLGCVIVILFLIITTVEWIKAQVVIVLAATVTTLLLGSGAYLTTLKCPEAPKQNP
jgi:multisubunit Na+/H+ antiporter MnhG subunit